MESTWALPDCQKRFVEHKYVKNLCFNQFPIKRPLFSNHLLWARASVGYSDLYQLAPEYVEEVDSLVKGKAFDILMCIHAKSLQLYPTLCNPMDCSPPGSSVHGIFQERNTGVGCHFLLQGIFPTQRSNLDLPHCRWILYHLSHQRSPVPPGTIAKLHSKGDKVIGSLCSQWRSQFPRSFYDSVFSNTTDICQSKRRNVGTTAFLFVVCLILFITCRIFPSVVVPLFI